MPADRILQWTVGDVQIHRIVEVANHADPIGILLKDATERIFDPFRSWLRPHADAATRTRVRFVSTYSDRQTLIIGSHFAGPTAGRIVTDDEHSRFVTERPTC